MVEPKALLLGAADAALRAVNGRQRVRDYLRRHPIEGQVCLVAAGKAAASMAQGAVDVLGAAVTAGLVVSKRGLEDYPLPANAALVRIRAGHPLPDEESLRAGHTLLDLLDKVPRDSTLLFLISGGASSLVEVLPDGVTLADLHKVNDWLLSSGWNIGAMNEVRKRLSCIKGGRLARWVAGRRACNLLMSDVPGDDPATVGSGLLLPGEELPSGPAATLPGWLRKLLRAAPPAPSPADPAFQSIRSRVIVSAVQARRAAVAHARSTGCRAHGHGGALSGDVLEVAGKIAVSMAQGPPGMHVWSGEPTVRLPRKPGRGGRNQSLALAVAGRIDGHPGTVFLSVGTDGDDGNTRDAGAIIDGATVAAGRRLGLDVEDYLERADAGSYLEELGALVYTGATGANVMDLMIGWRQIQPDQGF